MSMDKPSDITIYGCYKGQNLIDRDVWLIKLELQKTRKHEQSEAEVITEKTKLNRDAHCKLTQVRDG